MDIPHGNFTAHYDVNTQYLEITLAETMAVELSHHQFSICQEANGQFCNIVIHFSHLPTLHLALQPYTPRTQPAFLPEVHYKSGKFTASVYLHGMH